MLCQEFASIMHGEFEMFMMGELNFYLGLQIKQLKDAIFISQNKYWVNFLRNLAWIPPKKLLHQFTPMTTNCTEWTV